MKRGWIRKGESMIEHASQKKKNAGSKEIILPNAPASSRNYSLGY